MDFGRGCTLQVAHQNLCIGDYEKHRRTAWIEFDSVLVERSIDKHHDSNFDAILAQYDLFYRLVQLSKTLFDGFRRYCEQGKSCLRIELDSYYSTDNRFNGAFNANHGTRKNAIKRQKFRMCPASESNTCYG